MNPAVMAAFGWLIPGGGYLPSRRYGHFAASFLLVTAALVSGLALQGGLQWPQAAELQGLDGFSAMLAQAGAIVKLMAGAPVVLAQWLGYSHGYIDGRLHEYGTTLLLVAGIINVLAIADAIEGRKR